MTFAAAATLAVATLAAGAASAQTTYRPLTVAPRGYYAPQHGYYAAPAPAYNPYAGPGAVVTAPVHFAGEIATLPFRAINSVFPAQGNTPLVVVGAPVAFAGHLVSLPFRAIEAPFGGPSPFAY